MTKNILDELYRDENETQAKILEVSAKIKEAKETKSFENIKELKEELKAFKNSKSVIKQKIKVEEHRYTVYCRAVKPYIDSKRIIGQADVYSRLDEIIAEYNT